MRRVLLLWLAVGCQPDGEEPPSIVREIGPPPEWENHDGLWFPPHWSGDLGLGTWRQDYVGGTMSSGGVSASFLPLQDSGHYEWLVEEIDPLLGAEDCGLNHLLETRIVAGPTRHRLEAGTVTAILPDDTPFELEFNGSVITYGLSFDDLGQPPYGEILMLEASGGESPALEPLALPALPDPFELTEGPDPGSTLSRDGLALAWTGSREGTVWISLSVGDWFLPDWVLRCTPTDDGDFEIPGYLLAKLPEGEPAYLYTRRGVQQELEATDGRIFGADAAHRHEIVELTTAP
jgi:hypothetical protein